MPRPAVASDRNERRRIRQATVLCWLLPFSISLAMAQGLLREEYACLSDVLQNGLGANAKQAVIAATTTGDPSKIVSSDQTIDVRAAELNTSGELLREWALRNESTFPLTRELSLSVPYSLLTEGDRDLLFRGDDPIASWKLFYARYPESPGLIRVSRVAFDATRTHALVYIELQCGAECGSGRLVQAMRTAGTPWRIEFGELIWIAGPAQ
jgi:hypothetical protein